jgi:ClpP class serine protease
LWVVVPLAVGIWLAGRYVETPAVGLIRLETDIWYGSAELFKMQLEEARADERIQALVIVIDSPGGEVAPTQDMFFELLSIREEMPVVASINSLAASGGFYLAMAADPIFAKPNSTVGNVGVERLAISPTDLSQGLAYSGRAALEHGLIDRLASQHDAVVAAAGLAGIENYEVVDLLGIVLERLYGEDAELIRPGFTEAIPEKAGEIPLPWYLAPWLGAADPVTGERVLPPGVYLLYDVRIGGAR